MCNCFMCNSDPDDMEELCDCCEGDGEVWDDDEDDYIECPECGGSGREDGW